MKWCERNLFLALSIIFSMNNPEIILSTCKLYHPLFWKMEPLSLILFCFVISENTFIMMSSSINPPEIKHRRLRG